MNTHNKSLLASSVKVALYGATALMASIATQNAYAQTTDEEEAQKTEDTEVIAVRGIRGALATAAELKRESNTFVDSITSSDATSLPDLSVAEALSRVPGVTVTKFDIGADGGDFPSAEGSGNLIRGLGLIRSELNGRDAFTADGSRALDWSSIPPQLIEGVDVYKNQTADLIEGGIGGTINLRTLEPFDREGRHGAISIEGTYSDLRDETTPTFSVVLGDRWQTDVGEFGLVGSFSRSELNSLFNGYQSGAIVPVQVGSEANDRFPDIDPEDFTGDIIPTVGQTVGIVNGFQLRSTEVDRERSNIYLAGQWQSNDDSFKVTAKYLRVDNETFDLERTVEWQDGGVAYGTTTSDSNIIATDVELSEFTSPGVPRCGNGAVSGEDENGDPFPQSACSDLIAIDGGLFEEGILSSNESAWYGAPGAQIGNLGIGRRSETTTDDISLNIEWQVDDQWFIEFDASRTTADLDFTEQWIGATTHLDFRSRTGIDNPELEFSFNPDFAFNQGNIRDAGNNVVPTAAPTSTADPAGYFLGYAADRFQNGESSSNAFEIDATYEFDTDGDDWFQAVKFGARRAERDQLYQDSGLNWQAISQAWNGGVARYNAFDSVAHEVVDFSDFQDGGVVVGDNTSFVFANSDFLRNPDLFYNFLATEPDLNLPDRDVPYSPFGTNPDEPRRNANFEEQFTDAQTSDVNETITNLYARFDFAQDFDNDMSLDGNFGLRYVSVDIESTGSFQFDEFSADEVSTDGRDETIDDIRDFLPEAAAFLDQPSFGRTGGLDDDYYLPSFNLKLNLSEDWLVRFGASRGLTLPQISDFSASQSVRAISSIDTPEPEEGATIPAGLLGAAVSRFVVSGGNTNLKPTTATNLDLAFEWYGGNGSSFSFAVFSKDIKDIIQSDTIIEIDSSVLDSATIPTVFQGAVNQSSADIIGFEISGQYFFDELEGIWSNFGIQANYTNLDVDADSPERSLDSDNDGEPDDFEDFDGIVRVETLNGIIGQSENFANLVGIYQDDKLEVRIAYQYRDEFLNSYETFITGNPNIQDENFSVDASVKYQINDNLQFNIQATNLTGEKQQSRDILNEEGQTYQRSSFQFDRRVNFGVQYKF